MLFNIRPWSYLRLLLICFAIILTYSFTHYFFKTAISGSPVWKGASDATSLLGKNKDGGSRPKPGEVLMVTASSGTNGFLGIPGLKEMVYENRMAYAHRWGYDFMWANITSYNFGPKIYWNKIPILRDAFDRFPKAKWIWWLDLDIIIMTPSLDLHTHILSDEGMLRNIEFDKELGRVGGGLLGTKTIASAEPDDMHFLISTDNWGMNVGSFLMRRSYWSDWVLEMWADPLATKQGWIMPENDGWVHLYRFHDIVRNHTACLNQRALNAYPSYNALGQHWHEGDLLVHFAGCGNSTKCPGYWDDMWQKREAYTVPDFVKEELEKGTAKIETVQKGIPM